MEAKDSKPYEDLVRTFRAQEDETLRRKFLSIHNEAFKEGKIKGVCGMLKTIGFSRTHALKVFSEEMLKEYKYYDREERDKDPDDLSLKERGYFEYFFGAEKENL